MSGHKSFAPTTKPPELELNETRFEDLGVSGWTGKNIETGALGDFIAAVKAGKIPKGSCLLVENWDRFSRLKPMEVYTKIGEIIKAGVDVITLEDGKFHTAENYHDFTNLIGSLVIMQRANEESATKMLGKIPGGVVWRRLGFDGYHSDLKICP